MEHLTNLSSKEFLHLLASNAPTPGGGGAAALAGALAAALASMLANLTIGKKGFAECEKEAQELLEQAESLRQDILLLVEKDAEVFDKFMVCYKMPKATEEEKAVRQSAISEAAKLAAEIPLQIAEISLQIMQVTARLAEIGNPNVITDGAVSALLARAALRGSVYNVEVNLNLTKDAVYNEMMSEKCLQIEKQALELELQTLKLTDKVIGK